MHGVWDSQRTKVAIRSHSGKAKSYELKTLNETILCMRRKKSITISHIQHKTTSIPTPLQPNRKNGDVRKRGDLHQEQEKVNKGKKKQVKS